MSDYDSLVIDRIKQPDKKEFVDYLTMLLSNLESTLETEKKTELEKCGKNKMESKNITEQVKQWINENKELSVASGVNEEKILELEKKKSHVPELYIYIEDLKILLANSLVMETCIESVIGNEFDHLFNFSPEEEKFYKAKL